VPPSSSNLQISISTFDHHQTFDHRIRSSALIRSTARRSSILANSTIAITRAEPYKMKITSLILIVGSAHGFSGGGKPQQQITSVTAEAGRREALSKGVAFFGAAISGFAGKAEALDMDAFMSAELEADEKNCDPKRDPKCKPKLSADEALCQYGQGAKKSEACRRVKAGGGDATQKGGGKSLGGAYAM